MEVRRQGAVLILRNHYRTRKRLSKYRSFAGIERALLQYCSDSATFDRGKWSEAGIDDRPDRR